MGANFNDFSPWVTPVRVTSAGISEKCRSTLRTPFKRRYNASRDDEALEYARNSAHPQSRVMRFPLVTLHQTKCPFTLPLSVQMPTESKTGISRGGEVVLCALLFTDWCRSELGKWSNIHLDRGVHRIWKRRKRGRWGNQHVIITTGYFAQGSLLRPKTRLGNIQNHRHRTLITQRDNPQNRSDRLQTELEWSWMPHNHPLIVHLRCPLSGLLVMIRRCVLWGGHYNDAEDMPMTVTNFFPYNINCWWMNWRTGCGLVVISFGY